MRKPGPIGGLAARQISDEDLMACILNVGSQGSCYANVHLALRELKERREADERDQAALEVLMAGQVMVNSLFGARIADFYPIDYAKYVAFRSAQAAFEAKHEPKPSTEDFATADKVIDTVLDDILNEVSHKSYPHQLKMRIAEILRNRRLEKTP